MSTMLLLTAPPTLPFVNYVVTHTSTHSAICQLCCYLHLHPLSHLSSMLLLTPTPTQPSVNYIVTPPPTLPSVS